MTERTDLRLDDEADPGLVEMLRDVYAPPAAGAYWDGLEKRIMARIADRGAAIAQIPVNWWTDLAGWAGPGMAAAALIIAVAGVVWSREKQAELRTTYEAVTEPAAGELLPGMVQVVIAPRDGSSQREAIFRYVLSH